MNDQLTLDVHLRADKRFDNFVVGDNQELVNALGNILQSQEGFFIWGREGLGKSHLLHAVCYLLQKNEQQSPVAFLALSEIPEFPPEILEGLELCQIVCIDNLHYVIGDIQWERSLFHLMNRLKDNDKKLLVSSTYPLASMNILLPDLRSRLGQLLNYELCVLTDSERGLALTQHAQEKGMKLDSEVLSYMLTHGPRDIGKLMKVLEELEEKSLKEKRVLSIPFLKKCVDW